MNVNIKEIEEQVNAESQVVAKLTAEIRKVIIGQKNMVEKLLIGLLTGGHILLEGVPGLAKTLAIKTIARTIDADFKRIQFTPDLLPADLVGTLIYNQKSGEFSTKKGPIFSNIILADEINRAPSKVQSALLESMQEKQVTIGEVTYKLEEPFWVLATENPIEQEGTYPLPEAQVDRFMLKVLIGYPEKEEEIQIVRKVVEEEETALNPVIKKSEVLRLREIIKQIYIDDNVIKYIVDIVDSTRDPQKYGIEPTLIAYGASPRASIYLALAAKANAFLRGRGFVTPEDVRLIGPDVLRHRVIISYEAEAEEKTSDDIILSVFDKVEVP